MGAFIDPTQTVDHEVEGTTFTLGVLTVAEYAAVQDAMYVAHGLDSKRGTHVHQLLRYGLKGWKDGPPFITDDDGYPTDETLGHLSGRVRIALANRLDLINTVGEALGKAYGLSSPPGGDTSGSDAGADARTPASENGGGATG